MEVVLELRPSVLQLDLSALPCLSFQKAQSIIDEHNASKAAGEYNYFMFRHGSMAFIAQILKVDGQGMHFGIYAYVDFIPAREFREVMRARTS